MSRMSKDISGEYLHKNETILFSLEGNKTKPEHTADKGWMKPAQIEDVEQDMDVSSHKHPNE